MNEKIEELAGRLENELTGFYRELVRTKGVTCFEKDTAMLVKKKMEELGYDEVYTDTMGNVLGRIGSGEPVLLFDSHTDTVAVNDEKVWTHDPFGAEVEDGLCYGRGSTDMKGGLAASVYAGYVAKMLGLIPEGKCVYVSASTMEEDYDGWALKTMLEERRMRPENVIVCEPTNGLQLTVGHRGRAGIEIRTEGVSCHGASPELGKNPVYMLEEIIGRVRRLNERLYDTAAAEHGSVTLTNIYCSTASNNSVPQNATVILDRRITPEETEAVVTAEMDELVRGTGAVWRFCEIPGTSWCGRNFMFRAFMDGWSIGADHPLVRDAIEAYREVRGGEPSFVRFVGNTNAWVTAGLMKIPTLIVGPGDLGKAHAKDEFCPLADVTDALKLYAILVERVAGRC